MENSLQDPGPADDGWERKIILPEEGKNEGEMGNSQYHPSPADRG